MNTTTEFKESELPAIQLFQAMGYDYYDASKTDSERSSIQDVLLLPRLQAALKRINPWLDDSLIHKAIQKLTPSDTHHDLISLNKEIHRNLCHSALSLSLTQNGRESNPTLHYIDYQNMTNNDFLVVNQMTFKGGTNHSKPDLVVFLNGVPIAVIECKSPAQPNAAEKGIDDLLHYQQNSPRLFWYNQICATLYKVGARYGAIQAQPMHYNVYNTENETPIAQLTGGAVTKQDILLYHLFNKESLLDLLRNFVIFENTEEGIIKKLPRYPQVRAVNKAIAKLKSHDKGGVIWHTQGSGKSLTMVYLATKLRRDDLGFNNPTIIVITDRTALDDQIHTTFRACGFPNPHRAHSIADLGTTLRNTYGKTIMTTIQKFQPADTEEFVPGPGEVLSTQENVFVFVDEAHRSQYGSLAAFMRHALPNAKFIAFTGTPIAKENKSTLQEFYGQKYLDVYTIKESVADGATLPIFYDAALPHLHVAKDIIDIQLAEDFADSTPAKLEKIKEKAAAISTLMNATPRIHKIAAHILQHYTEKVRPNGFKAMIVCHSREAAVNYKDALDSLALKGQHTFKSKIIMTLDDKRDSERFKHLATEPRKIKQAIKSFKNPFRPAQPDGASHHKKYDNTAILIVCDMLLTGYDAPIVQVMYLDKILKEHNLLQAIARVNRTRRSKTAGYIIDYCGITGHLTQALAMYAEDLLPNEVMESPGAEYARLQFRHQQLVAFFGFITVDRVTHRSEYITQAVKAMEPQDQRDTFKVLLAEFNTSFDILLPAPEALFFLNDFKLYNEIKYEAANTYVDETLRLSRAESLKIQELVNHHLQTLGISYLLEEPVAITDQEKFQAEISRMLPGDEPTNRKKTYRIKHILQVNMAKDPVYYKPLWERLKELIERVEHNRLDQLSLFAELEKVERAIIQRHLQQTALGFSNDAQFAVYNTLLEPLGERAQDVTHTIFQQLQDELQIRDWKDKEQVQKTMRVKIKDILRGKVPDGEKDHLAIALLVLMKENEEKING